MKVLTIFFIFLFAHVSYAQDTLIKINTNLIGRWDEYDHLVSSQKSSTWVGPSQCGCRKYLIFKPNNIVEEYRNDTLIKSSNYSLRVYYFMTDPVKVMMDGDVLSGQVDMRNDSVRVGALGGCGIVGHYRKTNYLESRNH